MTTIAIGVVHWLSQTTTGAAGGTGAAPQQPFWQSIMFPVMIGLVIMMVFSFTSKRKQDKQRQAQLNSMKRGDRVQTIGGILGTIVEVRDADIVVKVDESNNTKIKLIRSAVTRVIDDDEKVDAK